MGILTTSSSSLSIYSDKTIWFGWGRSTYIGRNCGHGRGYSRTDPTTIRKGLIQFAQQSHQHQEALGLYGGVISLFDVSFLLLIWQHAIILPIMPVGMRQYEFMVVFRPDFDTKDTKRWDETIGKLIG